MVGIALLGAGLIAKNEHLPAIEAAGDLELVAIYSRSQSSAESLAALAKSRPGVYFDSPTSSGQSLDNLLERSDIAAVVVCIPILDQPGLIRKALSAGKHVLSEKPIAADVATATGLVDFYASLPSEKPLWAVAENFRFLESLEYAASKLEQVGGDLVNFRLVMNGFVEESDEYFGTGWRKVPGYQGGFLLDGGVHFVACLRQLLRAAGDEVKQVSGLSSLMDKRLIPVDTLHAVATTGRGVNGLVNITFATEFSFVLEVGVDTTKGSITWTPLEVKSTTKGGDGKKATETKSFEHNLGIKAEASAFSKGIQAGTLDLRQSPGEALKDLAFLQALLETGEAKAPKGLHL